ncbi:MAG: redoxin domain-containing protein [Clostridiales bacterium]|nr:redoxin domain-containing protein [Clostridiales bacterium]
MPALNVSATSINIFIVFLEGVLSFFSPCVIPLIPVYVSYLAGNAKISTEDGRVKYIRKRVFLHTLLFVLGISSAFFILGMSVNALRIFFNSYQMAFVRAGGLLIIFLGLVQTGIIKLSFLQREHRFNFNIGERRMSPLLAYIMGFTFSFGWTPCIGPALSSVLVLAAGSDSRLAGNLLILVYTAGFVIPFMLLGLFTTQVLNFLNRHKKALRYTVKAGGILLIIIGFLTLTGWMNSISRYLNSFTASLGEQTGAPSPTEEADSGNRDEQATDNGNKDAVNDKNDTTDGNASSEKEKYPAFDFTLVDQNGTTHTLSDYKGKVVFLNFWATWCPPCKKELPDIEELYREYGENSSDVIFLSITNPVSDEYPNNADITKDKIIDFIKENDISFPVLFDETGEVLSKYYISAFPTTFLIDTDGNIYGYAPGMLSKETMISAIEQTKKSTGQD